MPSRATKAKGPRSGQRTDEVGEDPTQRGARSTEKPGIDDRESLEKRPVATVGEPREVVRPLVYGLQEGRVRVHESVVSEDPVDLVHDLPGLEDMLEHRLDHDGVDRSRGEGDAVRVGDELGQWACVDVERDQVDVVCFVEIVDLVAHGPTPDDEDARGERAMGGSAGSGAIPESAAAVTSLGASAVLVMAHRCRRRMRLADDRSIGEAPLDARNWSREMTLASRSTRTGFPEMTANASRESRQSAWAQRSRLLAGQRTPTTRAREQVSEFGDIDERHRSGSNGTGQRSSDLSPTRPGRAASCG